MSPYNFSKIINPQPGWYRGDFHVHSNASADGDYPPTLVAEIARAEGLDFIALTDHNTIEGYKDISEGLDFLVIPGLEVTLDRGHINVFCLEGWRDWMEGICGDRTTTPLPDRYRSADELTTQITKQGLLTSINHPLLPPWAWLYNETDLRNIHCVELWNDLYWPDHVHGNPKAVALWTKWLDAGLRITAIGGSDYHYPPRPEENKYGERLGMPTTYVYAEQLSGEGILHGLMKHRAYVTRGPQIIFRAEMNGVEYRIGDDLGVQEGEIRFAAAILHKPVTMQVYLIKNGQVIASQRIQGKEASLEFHDLVASPSPGWYRLDINDQEGQPLAITNPIFLGPRHGPEAYR